ncbi:hypothetical protein ColTof3_14846 [Colletotrichum tofieldiae]|nr:hypothetical protein ColTof3_14846 [Colletotrichum tofieldiae]
MDSVTKLQSPEDRLADLIARFPSPDADAAAFELIIGRRDRSVPCHFRLCWTGCEIHHPTFTEEAVIKTLKYYGFNTHGAQCLAQDALHCRKNCKHYKALAEKKGRIRPPEDVTENERAKPKADPILKGVIIVLAFMAILLGLCNLYARL